MCAILALPTASDVVRPNAYITAFHNTLTRPSSACSASEFYTMGLLWPIHYLFMCCRISVILYQHYLAESCPWESPKVSPGSLQHASQEPIFAVKLGNSNRSCWSALVPSKLAQSRMSLFQHVGLRCAVIPAWSPPSQDLFYDSGLHSCFMNRTLRLLDKDHSFLVRWHEAPRSEYGHTLGLVHMSESVRGEASPQDTGRRMGQKAGSGAYLPLQQVASVWTERFRQEDEVTLVQSLEKIKQANFSIQSGCWTRREIWQLTWRKLRGAPKGKPQRNSAASRLSLWFPLPGNHFQDWSS